jgi:hypothetical protein
MNVTAYGSAYVALAEELGCELLTADQRLARAAGPKVMSTAGKYRNRYGSGGTRIHALGR